MDIKRRAARVIAILAIALGAGHFVQSMGKSKAPRPAASAELAQKPKAVQTVAAGPELTKPTTATQTETTKGPVLPAQPLTELAKPEAPVAAPVAPALATIGATPMLPATPEPAKPAVAEATPLPVAPAVVAEAPPLPEADPCAIALDLLVEPSAMIGITLLAPCNPNQRIVLRHGGLAVTGQTTANGALFTALPALETEALVEVAFADGTKAEASLSVPDLAVLRRFGVQWQADDAFQLHAFEGAAAYDDPGHVSAADTHRPSAGQPAVGGFLTLAGDSTTENPLLAEIYTFPMDPAQKPEIVLEAAVTEATCGRELIGETLTTTGGTTFITDLTLAMPECDAIGDYLVLKNLVPDLNMAAAN